MEHLAGLGMGVAIFDRDADRGAALAEKLGDRVTSVSGDVCDDDDVASAVEAAQGVGTLSVVVNVAGGATGAGRILGRDGSPADKGVFTSTMDMNAVGTFNVSRIAAAAIAGNEPDEDGQRGAIVNLASVAAFDGQIGQASYSASKGGVVGMTLPVARDLSASGIRLNTVAPGLIDTPIYGQGPDSEAFKAKLGESVLFPKRLGVPDELASMVVECLTNSYMNGEVVRVDGGIRMPPK